MTNDELTALLPKLREAAELSVVRPPPWSREVALALLDRLKAAEKEADTEGEQECPDISDRTHSSLGEKMREALRRPDLTAGELVNIANLLSDEVISLARENADLRSRLETAERVPRVRFS